MNPLFKKVKWPLRGALAVLLFAPGLSAAPPFRRMEEPRWMTLRVSEASVGVLAEGTWEETTFNSGGQSIQHRHLFVGPSVGVNLDGSIYHPHLFRYHINTEGSYGWGQDEVKSPTASQHRNTMEYLGRFSGSADILANKSYNARLFSNYDHTFRDYDFFSRVTVDSLRYGAQIHYQQAPFSVSAGYTHHEEESSGLIGSSDSENDIMTLHGRNDRDRGSTMLDYAYTTYRRGDFGATGTGKDHSISVADSEKFGPQDQFHLNTGASYSQRDSFNQPSEDLNANANFTAAHRPNLNSLYDLSYDRYRSGSFRSDNYMGRAQLRHQLYESLTTTLIAQASDNEVSDTINEGYVRRWGGGFTEGYVKRLGENHRLSINNAFLVEHVAQDNISTVENERHVFSGSAGGSGLNSFFLNLPRVITLTIVVTDANDTSPAYVRGIDYGISSLGERTLLERLPGSRIPDGSTVLVDYRTEPAATGSYESMSDVFQIRFDLWKNLWGIYARLNFYTHNAPPQLRVQNLTSYTFGTDVTWRWMRAGTEYEIYDSDQSAFRSLRLFQSFSFRPDDASTLGFEFSESWTEYENARREEQNYRFVLMYHRNLSQRWRFDFDGGVHLRQGRDVDQTMATARPGVEYVIGKTRLKAGYDFEHQLFLEREERNRHLLFLRAKRIF